MYVFPDFKFLIVTITILFLGEDSCFALGLGGKCKKSIGNRVLLCTLSRAPKPPVALACRAVPFSGDEKKKHLFIYKNIKNYTNYF